MKYIVEESLRNFNFWSGGKERADMCSSSELDCIEEFLEEIEPEEGWTDTAINDMFWFEFDTLAQHLGVGQSDEEWEEYEAEDDVADYVIRCYENNEFCLMEYLFDEDDSGHEYVDDRIPTTKQLRKWAMAEKGNNTQTEQK